MLLRGVVRFWQQRPLSRGWALWLAAIHVMAASAQPEGMHVHVSLA